MAKSKPKINYIIYLREAAISILQSGPLAEFPLMTPDIKEGYLRCRRIDEEGPLLLAEVYYDRKDQRTYELQIPYDYVLYIVGRIKEIPGFLKDEQGVDKEHEANRLAISNLAHKSSCVCCIKV